MTRSRSPFTPWVGLLLFAGVFTGILAGGILAFTRDLPQIRSLEDYRPSAVTRIYSADRILLAELFVEKRDPVALSAIPDYLKQAVITTEDRNFYSHSGIDLKGILRAAVRDIMAREFVEGASTITQQLAKTLFLTSRKTLQRKIKEAILAFQLERRYTKDELLERYLNQIYLGSGAYGVQAAADRYFGKRVQQLDLAQCALIAAMPKAPSRYSPLVAPVLAVKRRNIVLRQMRNRRIITEAQYRSAVEAPLNLTAHDQRRNPPPYFVDHIKKTLEETLGSGILYKGGLTVETTLDAAMQAAAEKAVADGLDALRGRIRAADSHTADPQCALIGLSVETGAMLAMVGGSDYTQNRFNRATDASRQPGSAFKPIVYALAVETGMAQDRQILDAPVVYKGSDGGRDWRPENFSKTYLGEVSLRKALVASKNIPAVRLIEILGSASVIRFARRMGIQSALSPNLSLALGTSETTLLELTSAYTVFPNRGERAEPFGIRAVTDASGRTLWRVKPRKSAVMSRIGAAIMVDMLRAVVTEGTGQSARFIRHPVAGKTGTTNEYRDALFVGFSPAIAAGVWVGMDRGDTLGQGETGARAALPIWAQFMNRILESESYRYFDMPDGSVRVAIDPLSGRRLEADDPRAVTALFKAGSEPGTYR